MKSLLVATRNRGKLVEFQKLLAPLASLKLVSMDEVPNAPLEVVEDGETFEANAAKKAREVAAATRMLTLADDSGIEVDALDGAPGVYSARFAGEPANDARNNELLLARLAEVPHEQRTARFRCVLAFADPNGKLGAAIQLCDGTWEGHIATESRGENGFGYDSLFVSVGESRTNGELSAAEKNARSHRAIAAQKMLRFLENYLSSSTP